MALNYVTLILDLADGSGSPVAKGTATLSPSVQLTDSADGMDVVAPVTATFRQGSFPQVRLLATDNTGPQPAGWGWTVSFSGVPGNPASFSFFLPFSGGATQHLSAQTPVSSVTTMAAFMPLPSGTPSSGQVPIATGSGEASVWGSPGAASLPLTTLGDTLYENATPTPARLPGNTTIIRKFYRQVGTGSVSAAPAWDTLVPGDLPAASTSAQGAVILDGTAGDIQALGAQAAGSTGKAADAGHVHPTTGVVLASSLPLSIPNGGTGQPTQQAAINALTGTQSAGKYLRSDGTNATLAAIQAADVPTLNQNTSGSSGSCTGNAATATNLAGGATVPAYLAPTVVTLTFGASIALDASLGNVFAVTLTSSAGTLASPSNATHDGQLIRVRVIQDATGGRTLAYGAAWDFGAAGTPTLSTAANKVDLLAAEYNAALGKWCVSSALGY